MLDNKFMSFCLMSSLIGYEQGKASLKEYDTNLSIYPCFKNVIMICSLLLNLKVALLIKEFMKTTIWICFKWQLAQGKQQRRCE